MIWTQGLGSVGVWEKVEKGEDEWLNGTNRGGAEVAEMNGEEDYSDGKSWTRRLMPFLRRGTWKLIKSPSFFSESRR